MKKGTFLGLFLILFLGMIHTVMADTQFSVNQELFIGPSMVMTSYNHTILSNTSFVTNTTFQIRSSTVGYAAIGWVVFFYNDSTTYSSPNQSTNSLVYVDYSVTNPQPGKLVDKIGWFLGKEPMTSPDGLWLKAVDFWTQVPVPRLTVNLYNEVNGSAIGGFCALFTSGTGATCEAVSASSIISGSDTGWNSEPWDTNYERLVNSFKVSGNVTRLVTLNGEPYSVTPHFTASNLCGSSNFNTLCGISGATFQNYCLTTDEFSQWCLTISASLNQSNEQQMIGCFNTIKVLNASQFSGTAYGNLTAWTTNYNNLTGTPYFNKSREDTASDADAREIIALFNYYNNDAYTNTSQKNAARVHALDMCLDFVQYEFVKTNKISNSNTSRNITYFPAGGGDVAGAGITGTDFMYSGYYGDFVLALGACGTESGNSSYFSIAQDVIENMMAAANWTPSTGFKAPPGRAFKWTNVAKPIASCTTICTPSRLDEPDGKRMAKVCAAEKIFEAAGRTLHPNLQKYCDDWVAAITGYTPTTYSREWYANGTPYVSPTNDQDTSSLATFIDMSGNISNVEERMILVGGHFDTGTNTFDSVGCQGLYNPSFATESMQYLVSDVIADTFDFTSGSSCGGAGIPVTYTQNGLRVVYNSPTNNTNITTTNITINFTIYNLNVSGNYTNGTLPQILYNSSFNTDPTSDGWALSSWVYNSSLGWIYNNVSSGGSAHTQNLSLSSYTNGFKICVNQSMGNATNMKWYFGTDSSSDSGDRVLFERSGSGGSLISVKHDGGNFSSYTIPAYRFNTTCIEVNQTGGHINVSTIVSGTGTVSWKEGIVNGHTYGSYNSFAPGDNMSLNWWNMSNINVTNIGTSYQILVSGGNSSMNVSYGIVFPGLSYVYGPLPYIANGTTITQTLELNASAPLKYGYWTVVLRSIDHPDTEAFPLYNFTYFANATIYNYCNATGYTITHNVVGNYSILLYNITAGHSQPIYFNASNASYNFNTTRKSWYDALNFSTYQALLSINAYRLFLNTSITGFRGNNTNVTNTTSSTTLFLKANNGTNNVQIAVTGNYTRYLTCLVTAPFTTQACNATGIYDNVFSLAGYWNGAIVNSFSILVQNTSILPSYLYSLSTTNGSIFLPLLQGYSYFFQFLPLNLSQDNATLQANASINYYNFSTYQVNILNLTFFDEINGSTITWDNITLQLISDPMSANYTTGNGTIITGILTPADYVARYRGTQYAPRLYQFTIDNQYTEVRLPMLRSSVATNVTVEVVDSDGQPLEGYTVKLLKYDLPTNTYQLNQIFDTNNEGIGIVNVQLNTEFYYFIVENDDTVVLTTTPSYIFGDTVRLVVLQTIGGTSALFTNQRIIGSITYDETTMTATFIYNDLDNVATQGCLYTYRLNVTGQPLYNVTCASSPSGIIMSTIDNQTGTAWLFSGIVTKNGQQITVAKLMKNFINYLTDELTNKLGLFMMIIVILLLMFILKETIPWMVIITSSIPFFFSLGGFIPISPGVTLIIWIIGIIAGVLIAL